MKVEEKRERLQKRRWRIRKKVVGTADRPRMSVCFTHKHIYVQFIDDTRGVTLAAISTRSKNLQNGWQLKANVKGAEVVGKLAGELALQKGITKVVFDRGGRKYHGKVKALADAARAAGLQF